jgi:hypothetical protein
LRQARRPELAEARRLNSDERYSNIARLKAAPGNFLGLRKIRALHEAAYFGSLHNILGQYKFFRSFS